MRSLRDLLLRLSLRSYSYSNGGATTVNSDVEKKKKLFDSRGKAKFSGEFRQSSGLSGVGSETDVVAGKNSNCDRFAVLRKPKISPVEKGRRSRVLKRLQRQEILTSRIPVFGRLSWSGGDYIQYSISDSL